MAIPKPMIGKIQLTFHKRSAKPSTCTALSPSINMPGGRTILGYCLDQQLTLKEARSENGSCSKEI